MRLMLSGFTLAAFLGTIAQCALADPELYTIKESTQSSGSHVKRPIVLAGNIPLDKRYADLTPEQKALLKSDYKKMGDKDEPPFPLNGLMPIYKVLGKTHESLEYEFKGPVTMNVQIDSQGNPVKLEVLESPDEQITAAVNNDIADQKFKPALCDGTPCAMNFIFRADLVGPDWRNTGATSSHVKPRDPS